MNSDEQYPSPQILQSEQRPKENFRTRSFAKIIISGFICYILVVATVMPNGTSFLGRWLSNIILPVSNQLGFTVNWNFFAPDPAQTMYISYVVNFKDEAKEPVQGYIPPQKKDIVVDSSERRLLYAMRFMIIEEKRLSLILGPYLCRQFQGASSIFIRSILEPILNLDAARGGAEEKPEATIMEHTHDCLKEADEVSL